MKENVEKARRRTRRRLHSVVGLGPAVHAVMRLESIYGHKAEWVEERRDMRVMAITEGYAMVMRNGSIPYVCSVVELHNPNRWTTDRTDDIREDTNAHAALDREEYERELRRRQKEHLQQINIDFHKNWKPCLHDSCPDCLGTGVKKNGGICVHAISCGCPKCALCL